MEVFNLEEEIEKIDNYQVAKYLMVTNNKIKEYDDIMVSISGGSDSDVILDMFTKLDKDKKIKYVWFDTGLEYKATKEHIKCLEQKYNIEILKEKAIKSIPISVKEYGQPFLSKNISEMIGRLQKYNFDFANDGNKDFEELALKYPKCKSAIKWWCNCNGMNEKGERDSRFNIFGRRFLKEFMIENPPTFKISQKCCKYAKKDVAKNFLKENKIQLNVHGVRKSEGGIRATSYKNCFNSKKTEYDEYLPLFFFLDSDKEYYKEHFNLKNSDCYEIWGFKRTGCAGCPYNPNYKEELRQVGIYEPNMHKACISLFGDSYKYTDAYKEFRDNKKAEEKKKEK